LAPLVPEGPLHPEDAVFGLLVGLLAGCVLRCAGRHGALLVPPVVVATFIVAHPGTATGAIAGRWVGLAAVVFVVGVAAGAGTGGPKERSARPELFAVLPAVASVWGIVPDTEAAVIGGSVVVGAWITVSARWGRGDAVLLTAIPVFAALVGSVGRPERLWPALVAVLTVTVTANAVARVLRQRAGTPTTVAPAATSTVTTAPAPTTAP